MKSIDTRFKLLLEKSKTVSPEFNLEDMEEITDVGADSDEMSDADAFASELDEPQTAESLKTRIQTSAAEKNIVDTDIQQRQAVTSTMKDELLVWIDIIEDFTAFLNGNDSSSVHRKISLATPDSMFGEIKVSEGKKISRAAIDLAGLAEALKSYLVRNP